MRASAAVLLAFGLVLVAVPARAQDNHLVLMGEPISFTDVADAADDNGDPFDLNLSATFVRTASSGTIEREDGIPDGAAHPGAVPGAINYTPVAGASQTTNVLALMLEAGIYHDFSIFARLPIVLSDDRNLTAPNGGVSDHTRRLTGDLFQVPFTSPTRSGIDQLTLGAMWGITNQFRSPSWPTWVLIAEAHINIGRALRPCSNSSMYPELNLDGTMTGSTFSDPGGACRGAYSETTDMGHDAWTANAGSSRGWNGVRIETRASRRFRYFEPYASIAFNVEFPDASGIFFASSGNLPGMERTIPPIMGEANFGVVAIPWEHRAKYQRFSLDFRGTFQYISEGLDYSPLYDALGTSHSRELSDPSCEVQADFDAAGNATMHPCTPGTNSGLKNYFYGITDVQQHVRFGGRINIEMQAAKYLRFGLGAGLYWTSPYLATFSDACNPNFTAPDVGSHPDPRIGACSGGTVHNPTYRDTIDLAGRRFRVDSWISFDLMATMTAMF